MNITTKLKRLWERIKNLIVKSGPVAQSDRATAFNEGACMWKIEKIIGKGDYLYAKVDGHPRATKNGYVLYHRIVMENHLGRLLNPNEVVHHKDGNKKNNSIDNLEVLDALEHAKLHGSLKGRTYVKLLCPQCGKIFIREKRTTFLSKKNYSSFNCTFCSGSCRGKFSRVVQLYGLTPAMKDAISKNVVEEYKVYDKRKAS